MSRDNVISIEDYKPHISGPAKCMECGYEWIAVAPYPKIADLQCPKCGFCRGYFEYPVGVNGMELINGNY